MDKNDIYKILFLSMFAYFIYTFSISVDKIVDELNTIVLTQQDLYTQLQNIEARLIRF